MLLQAPQTPVELQVAQLLIPQKMQSPFLKVYELMQEVQLFGDELQLEQLFTLQA